MSYKEESTNTCKQSVSKSVWMLVYEVYKNGFMSQ